MKNSQIVASINNLYKIINSEKEYSRKVSYAITRNLFSLQELYKPYDEERKKIVEKYSEKNENEQKGEPVISAENEAAYERELKDLLEIEVNFTPHKVELEEFPENVSPSLLYTLDFMIG